MSLRHRTAALLCAAVLAESASSAALPAPEAPSAARSRVQVVVVGSAHDADDLGASLGELFRRLGVELVLTRVDTRDQAPVPPVGAPSVRVDLTAPGAIVVELVDRSGTVSVRRVERQGSTAVALDEAAHVIQAAAESLLGSTPPEEKPPEPPPAPAPTMTPAPAKSEEAPPQVPPTFGADALVLLGLHAVDPSAVAPPSLAGAVHVAHRASPVRPGLWLLGEYRFPFEIDDSPIPPQADAFSMRLYPAIDVARSKSAVLALGLGGGFDRFRIRHGVEDPEGHAHSSRGNRLTWVASGLLAFRVRLVENVQLSALGLVDFDPNPPDLEIRPRYPERSRAYALRPGLLLGVSFSPLGRDPIP